MSITLVAAIGEDNCIGKDGRLPWHLPADLRRMRRLTLGKVLIMGRKTWESIPPHRRPLPGRTNVVITRNDTYSLPQTVERFGSLEAALQAHAGEDVVGFGGAGIFAAMIKVADRLEITHVKQTVPGCDTFFPKIDPRVWQAVWREEHPGFSFVRYLRKPVSRPTEPRTKT